MPAQIRMTVAEMRAFNALTKGQVSGLLRKANKYGAKRTEVDGHTFDSAKEAKRYSELRVLQADGSVLWFALQPKFILEGGSWRADFVVAWSNGTVTVHDTKGHRTHEYKRIKRMVEQRYKIKVVED